MQEIHSHCGDREEGEKKREEKKGKKKTKKKKKERKNTRPQLTVFGLALRIHLHHPITEMETGI